MSLLFWWVEMENEMNKDIELNLQNKYSWCLTLPTFECLNRKLEQQWGKNILTYFGEWSIWKGFNNRQNNDCISIVKEWPITRCFCLTTFVFPLSHLFFNGSIKGISLMGDLSIDEMKGHIHLRPLKEHFINKHI